MSITAQIKSAALDIGFHKVGIAKAEALGIEAQQLENWLSRGFHASMKWMENNLQKRIDPRQIVSNAQSVITLAMNYYTPAVHSSEENTGKISRYAWGDDYHDIMSERIQTLIECIKQIKPDSENRYYVDTGPVMDKVWAVRGGIGWMGKHTNVITKEYGSWVFLGEIITTLELDHDTPMEDFCGSCTACIDACPTDAIREPYVVDSNRCLSYLTIEHRGEIDEKYHETFEGWVYGCDICQDVCPWNRFQKETEISTFQPRDWNSAPVLDELISISADEFARRYKGSPIKRTKREGLVRNAKIIKKQK